LEFSPSFFPSWLPFRSVLPRPLNRAPVPLGEKALCAREVNSHSLFFSEDPFSLQKARPNAPLPSGSRGNCGTRCYPVDVLFPALNGLFYKIASSSLLGLKRFGYIDLAPIDAILFHPTLPAVFFWGGVCLVWFGSKVRGSWPLCFLSLLQPLRRIQENRSWKDRFASTSADRSRLLFFRTPCFLSAGPSCPLSRLMFPRRDSP